MKPSLEALGPRIGGYPMLRLRYSSTGVVLCRDQLLAVATLDSLPFSLKTTLGDRVPRLPDIWLTPARVMLMPKLNRPFLR